MAPPHSPADRSDARAPARAPIIHKVLFHLKPHLFDFAGTLAGGDVHVIDHETRQHLLTEYVRASIGKSITHPQNYADFCARRKPLQVLITQRFAEEHGVEPRRYQRFENLLEHLFYQMLLVHCDVVAQLPCTEFTSGIRHFMDAYDIGGDSVNYDTLRRTIENIRARRDDTRKNNSR